MSKIFGGSKSQQSSKSTSVSESSSSNRAFDFLRDAYSPVISAGNDAFSSLRALLGGDQTGFNNYKDATGFKFAEEQGAKGLFNQRAAGRTLQSGAAGKALVRYGNDIQQQYAGNYMDRLLGQAGLGMQAGSLVGGAGQTSKSFGNQTSESQGTSSSSPGIGGFLGAAMASDRRLKTDIKHVGETPEGLGLYEYKYVWDQDTVHTGVMADEVAKIKPEALGPEIDGYMTVDYSKLELV